MTGLFYKIPLVAEHRIKNTEFPLLFVFEFFKNGPEVDIASARNAEIKRKIRFFCAVLLRISAFTEQQACKSDDKIFWPGEGQNMDLVFINVVKSCQQKALSVSTKRASVMNQNNN